MKDVYGDRVKVEVEEGGSYVYLEVSDYLKDVDSAQAALTAKKARRLAKRLLEAAEKVDPTPEPEPEPEPEPAPTWKVGDRVRVKEGATFVSLYTHAETKVSSDQIGDVSAVKNPDYSGGNVLLETGKFYTPSSLERTGPFVVGERVALTEDYLRFEKGHSFTIERIEDPQDDDYALVYGGALPGVYAFRLARV